MSSAANKRSLFVIFLTVFIDLLGFGIVLPLLPIYGQHFTMDESGWVLGLLMASFSAMQFIWSPVWGRLSDRIGRRPVLMIGLTGSTVCYFLFGIATIQQSLTLLFVSRVGAGISGATISTAQAYIADVTSAENRTRGMALIGAAFGLGFTFGPLLGYLALLAPSDSPLSPWPGYFASLLSGGALVLAYFLLPESLRQESPAAGQHFNRQGLTAAVRNWGIASLLIASFISVLSFANFETTLSLLLKHPDSGLELTDNRILLLVFAYIGIVLSLAQGLLVRRLAKRVSDGLLASGGAVVSILGFLFLIYAATAGSLGLLMVALAVEVIGFAFVTPSLQALISRRTDPRLQGGVLGVSQSVSSLARIVGPLIGIPLFAAQITLPYWVATGLMLLGLLCIVGTVFRGGDWQPPAES